MVDSDLIALGLRRDGSLQTPPEGFPAGWYTGAATPGAGAGDIAGHVDWNGEAGVFFRLRDMQPGDEILVARADDSTAVFGVAQVESFASHAPQRLRTRPGSQGFTPCYQNLTVSH